MKDVSRIQITRQHLKNFRKQRLYDGIRVYKTAKPDPELMRKTAAVLYDIYLNMKSAS